MTKQEDSMEGGSIKPKEGGSIKPK